MKPSAEAIRKVIDRLVLPNFPDIISYNVSFRRGYNDAIWTFIDVVFDYKTYFYDVRTIYGHHYAETEDVDYMISTSMKDSLKYLGLTDVIVNISENNINQ